MTSRIIYTGNLRTEMTHIQSGHLIETDAPIDNNGKGERFSPTDLVATALGSCMLTIMGISANTHEINMLGTQVEITKIMISSPRKIGEIKVKLKMKGQDSYSDKQRSILENAAKTCPVLLSLHEDIKKNLEFTWP